MLKRPLNGIVLIEIGKWSKPNYIQHTHVAGPRTKRKTFGLYTFEYKPFQKLYVTLVDKHINSNESKSKKFPITVQSHG